MSYNLKVFLNQLKKIAEGWKIENISIIQRGCGDISSGICEFVLSNNNIIRRGLLCSKYGIEALSIENVTDQIDNRIVFKSLSNMLEVINEHLRKNCDEEYIQVSMYSDLMNTPYVKFGSIIPLEDVEKLQLGFRFNKDGAEWWTDLSTIKSSYHSWKKLFATINGRKIVANHLCRNWVTDPEFYESMYEREHD